MFVRHYDSFSFRSLARQMRLAVENGSISHTSRARASIATCIDETRESNFSFASLLFFSFFFLIYLFSREESNNDIRVSRE